MNRYRKSFRDWELLTSAKVNNFTEIVMFRISKDQLRKVKKVVKKNKDYESISHFYRCAILRQLREEEKVR